MEQPFSTSKVTVEYSDPHGVYKLIAPGLIPRLPLRNLHWQSHAGPLRSIDTVHVELVPEGSVDPKPILSPDAFFPSLQRSDSSASARDKVDGFQTQIGASGRAGSPAELAPAGHRNSTPVRRHQIPGLRRTPYLKVLLVRCDDNDSYKSTVRQDIRDWIKTHTPSATGSKKTNNAENHDAFEWLVLHVIVPNTAAAAQPRVTGKSEAAEKATAASRWRPGSSTLLEKLRSDFNSSSKGAVDRISQIRIGVNDVPYDILPRVANAVPSSYKETTEESEAAWNDLVTKMRAQILASFDLRVSQYEEDIKEKDSQRSLPGWNFCTFFILKEGLARGFESVGLVEDALVGYDELSVGLDLIIKSQASGDSGSTANALLSYTGDLHEAANRALSALRGAADDDEVVDMQAPLSSSNTPQIPAFDEIPISATKKPYRELILENKVSIFDFRCYIFARQIALLQRLGNVWSTREELLAKLKEQQESIIHGVAPSAPPPKPAENEHEDLSMLAEICRRTLEFIPSVSQVMRSDILVALAADRSKSAAQDQKPNSLEPMIAEIIDNLVASFAFSIAQQVLAQTSTKALPIPPSTLAPPDGHEQKAAIPEPKTMMHPARSSSLRVSTGGVGVGRPPQSPNTFPGPGQHQASFDHQISKDGPFLKAGLEELAARRAELYGLSRNILEKCGKTRGWDNGWTEVPIIGGSSMVDLVEVDLNEDSPHHPQGTSHPAPFDTVSMAGIENKLLRTALDTVDDFYRLFETLTDKALRHYTVANHTHSIQASMADLAVLKYHLGDYGVAAAYFWRTTPFFGESGWSLLELSMLVMYSKCLKQLQRKDEFVKVMLKLLSKASAAERERLHHKASLRIGAATSVAYPENDSIKGFLADLMSETKLLTHEIHVPLSSFFSVIEVDRTPEYHDGRDSFSVYLKLNSLLVDDLDIDRARVRMVTQIAGVQRTIWLELASSATVKPGMNKLKLNGNVLIPGTYEIDKVDISASNLYLYHERNLSQARSKANELLIAPRITVFQRAETLDVRLSRPRHVQLDKSNTVEIELDSGWNDLVSVDLRVKAATGGLRLLTAEARCIDAGIEFSKSPEAGILRFGVVARGSTIRIRVPYTVETDVPSISIRLECEYITEYGTMMLSKTPSVTTSLALGVNVQDVFKHNTLFSRFTVSTASPSPLRLFQTELLGSDVFESHFGVPPANPTMVFLKQPASLLYKIKRKRNASVTPKSAKTMYIKLHYEVIQDEVESLFERSITEFVKDTPVQSYSRLLVDTVLPLVGGLSSLDLERATLLGSVSTAFLGEVAWAKLLAGLGRSNDGQDNSQMLASFLVMWRAQNQTLSLPQEARKELNSLLIPVDTPSITIVHTADIRLQRASPPLGFPTEPGSSAITTNQLIPAILHLKWTRIWDTATPIQEMSDMEFSYEVTAPGDAWLIGGRRKGHFVIPAPSSSPSGNGLSSGPETEADIPLLLIPQREGWLSYPGIDIREVRPAMQDITGTGSGGQVTPVTEESGAAHCETDLSNLGEAIRVVSDREQITLSLDASGPGGGPFVLDVQTRGLSGRVVG